MDFFYLGVPLPYKKSKNKTLTTGLFKVFLYSAWEFEVFVSFFVATSWSFCRGSLNLITQTLTLETGTLIALMLLHLLLLNVYPHYLKQRFSQSGLPSIPISKALTHRFKDLVGITSVEYNAKFKLFCYAGYFFFNYFIHKMIHNSDLNLC